MKILSITTFFIFLLIFENVTHALSCIRDPFRTREVCAKMKLLKKEDYSTDYKNQNKKIYRYYLKEVHHPKEWKAHAYDQNISGENYTHLKFGSGCGGEEPLYAFGDQPDELRIVDEAECANINVQILIDDEKILERELFFKRREREELQFRNNPELKYAIFVYGIVSKDNKSLSLSLKEKSKRKFRGADFVNYNFGTMNNDQEVVLQSKIKIDSSKTKHEFRLLTLDINNNPVEEMGFDINYVDKKSRKKLRSDYILAYFEKIKPVRKVQLFHKDVVIVEKDFDYTKERMD